MTDEVRERTEAEESPFTLNGHPTLGLSGPGQPLALPPKKVLGNCNYWLLDESILANMQWAVTPLDPSVPVFKMPHAVIEGVVDKVISETDGDHHLWVTLDNSKYRLACEITPQQALTVPKAGDHVRVYGLLRYDLQHGWPEIHPIDQIDVLP